MRTMESKVIMKSHTKQILALLIGAVLLYGGWMAWRAHQSLVTLNVRNLEVRKVVSKIEWQTWADIFVHKDVQGTVTLNVRRMPLAEVLRLIGDQTSSRHSLIYPLYSNGKSLAKLKKSLRGEIDPAENGWTNLESRVGFRGGPGGGFGGGGGGMMFGGGPGGGRFGGAETNQNPRVSLDFQGKDLAFATLAFSRFAQTRVVPDDAASPLVNLSVNEVTVPKAVAKLAKSARRSWASYYTLRGFGFGGPGGPGGRGGFAMRDGDTNGDPRGFARQEMTEAQRAAQFEEMRKQREAQEEELRQALPLAERQRLEAEQQQREQQMKEMQSLTPEQRQARFAQMRGGSGAMDRRNIERFKNSTPAQRAMQQRQMTEMRKRFQEQGGQPRGPGQPGQPGGQRPPP